MFASLLELQGLRPIIYVVPGHAFVGVESRATGYNTAWPLETTALGSGTTWASAVSTAIDTVVLHQAAGTVDDYVYIDEARAAGLLSMP